MLRSVPEDELPTTHGLGNVESQNFAKYIVSKLSKKLFRFQATFVSISSRSAHTQTSQKALAATMSRF